MVDDNPLIRLAAHEAVCAERWAEVRRSISGLWTIVVVSAGTLIIGMAGLIVTLALNLRAHP